jgi:hypothetical protein
MLFAGLLIFLVLQPFVAGVAFPLEAFVTILVMGLLVFVPFGLFMRGLIASA